MSEAANPRFPEGAAKGQNNQAGTAIVLLFTRHTQTRKRGKPNFARSPRVTLRPIKWTRLHRHRICVAAGVAK